MFFLNRNLTHWTLTCCISIAVLNYKCFQKMITIQFLNVNLHYPACQFKLLLATNNNKTLLEHMFGVVKTLTIFTV